MNETAAAAERRGQALLDLGRGREAEEQFRIALAATPDDPDLLTQLAQALLEQDRHQEAHDVSRAAVGAAPEHVMAYSILSASLAGLERLPEAREAVRRALGLAPHFAGLHVQEARVLLAQNLPAEALASVARARALHPEDADAAAVQAAALYDMNRFGEAQAAVHEALRLDPESVVAHRVQGLLALRRGGGAPAIQAHRTALRLSPTDSGARDGLAVSLKSRNPLYGLLLRYSMWLQAQPKALRLGMVILPLVLTRLLRPFDDQPWATALLVLVLAYVVLSWSLEPLMNTVLLLSRDRHVLGRPERLATYAFLGFAGAGLAVLTVGLAGGFSLFQTLALGLGLWAMSIGSAHTVRAGRVKVLTIGAGVAAVLATVAFAGTLAGVGGLGVAVMTVLLGGIASLWFTAFA
ncbi:tetratricopeptide repeat protein [Promicromonospora sp. AC04]|uniref:tetratricopeptide repeat protein n=1 Tax=Promicromonospora sp. AC04 TaxID=2135723 RepID=UPI000D39D050|nr:tetratricopeptide repeat protein [Promicromonospora sp. AC04]PUB31960.1 tetratricopeptide repeat protein [Promicromonospora sp. AC04]